MSIEVIIGDKEILDKFSESKEYANATNKIKDAGDFSKLTDDIAKAAILVDKGVGKGGSLSKAEKDFLSAVDTAIDDARARAAEEAGRLGGLKGKARWANAIRGGKLVLTFAGAAAAIAGLAATPFTAGVSTVAGCVGLAKAAVSIGKQMADIASTAEKMANGIAKDLNTLKKQYSVWLKQPEVAANGGVSNKMGMAELAKSGLNALTPVYVTTIKSVKDDAGTYEEKIDNMEVRVDNLADNLTDQLNKQALAIKQFKSLQTLGRDALNDKETKLLIGTLSLLEKSKKDVVKLIKVIQVQNKRVSLNRKNAKALNKQLKAIEIKNPLWSNVGIVIFEVTASVAFTLAGNVNAPDPYKFAKPAMDIISALDTTSTALQDAESMASSLSDEYKKKKAKIKA